MNCKTIDDKTTIYKLSFKFIFFWLLEKKLECKYVSTIEYRITYVQENKMGKLSFISIY